ncbi:endo-1,4-beta-xylanase [Xanthomonas campestris pv. badrii]|uniref:Beta-xylanase n=1 Tax=Xanthomonas campestris pv. badrii TaxID=149696 RepID=A0A7Z2VDH9_XANCA|nr:endo-1,4-beta-xylanase [Xanthomonas campestris]QJD69453.1 endo-1,4-beta-xylanase [Xanthomonas campestris pv. badrii]
MPHLLTLLRGACVVAACLVAGPALARCETPDTSLKQAYADGFLLGTAVNAEIVSGKDAASAALVACQFNALTPENVMKAEVVAPRPGVFDFAAADAFVAYAQRQRMFVVGHTLVWHNQTPEWFFVDAQGTPNTSAAQIERMRAHIERVAGRYVGTVQAWDVVNEIIDEDGSYRATNWVQRVGDGDTVVRNAFAFAQRYAPDAELYYNDFNAWRPAKRDGIVRMVRMLQQAGIRIDGVGMQGHWGLNYHSVQDIEAAIDAYAALGIKVMITELDVDVLPVTREGQVIGTGLAHKQFQLPEFKRFLDPYRDGLPPQVQAQLTARYAELFALFWRKRDTLARVSVWGVTDGMSWKNDYPVPGRTNHPLLFDRNHAPKPALEAVLAVPEELNGQMVHCWHD